MNNGPRDWRRSVRTPPTDPGLLAEAKANAGGHVYAIDGETVAGDPNGYVPPEAIRGCWAVGPDGTLTGEYFENPDFGPPTDDFRKLIELDHFWGWLDDKPDFAVRESVADVLTSQVPGAVLEWMKVTDTPEVLTGGRRVEGTENDLLLTRAAVAVPFALSVRQPDGARHVLWGVFTWAAGGLDPSAERRDRVWFDLNTKLAQAKEILAERIYEI